MVEAWGRGAQSREKQEEGREEEHTRTEIEKNGNQCIGVAEYNICIIYTCILCIFYCMY